jgi:uncharacterized membrane protein
MSKNENTPAKHPLTRGLGWFALGLGAAELVAPNKLAKLLGLRPGVWTSGIIRACGAREALSGVGILAGSQSSFWLGARLAGDVADAGLLWSALAAQPARSWYAALTGRRRRPRVASALLAVGGVSLLDAVAFGLGRRDRRPGRGARAQAAVTAAITIDRTPADVYAFWRDLENLPRFVTYLESVSSSDRIRSHWRAKLPHGPALEWDGAIIEDRPDQRIVWKMQSSKVGMLIDSGEVRFEPAPGGGTEVHLRLWGGAVPGAIGRWLRKLPERFCSAQLHRLKQLLELGEITVSDASPFPGPHPARPAKEALTSAPLASSAAPTPGPMVVDERRPS